MRAVVLLVVVSCCTAWRWSGESPRAQAVYHKDVERARAIGREFAAGRKRAPLRPVWLVNSAGRLYKFRTSKHLG